MLWASTTLPVGKSEGDFAMMALLVLKSNAGPPAHKVVLTLLSLMSPKPRQTFWECTYRQDLVGNEFVEIPLELSALTTDAELSMWMMRQGGVRIASLKYKSRPQVDNRIGVRGRFVLFAYSPVFPCDPSP
jgi:hypothetical protein